MTFFSSACLCVQLRDRHNEIIIIFFSFVGTSK